MRMQISPQVQAFWSSLVEFFNRSTVEFVVKLVGGVVVLFVGFRLAKLALKIFDRSHATAKMEPTVRSFVRSCTSIVLKASVIIVCAGLVGIPTTSLLALLGSIGVAIGLAMQGSLANLAGGVMLLLFKPFETGDYITIPNVDGGTVEAISIFYTTIVTVDNRRIVIPNGLVSNSSLTNYSSNDTRRIELDFPASYDANSETVRKIMLAAVTERKKLLPEPAPDVVVKAMADSAVIYQLRCWCNTSDYWAESFALRELVKRRFDENGIGIPFTQVDVHMK